MKTRQDVKKCCVNYSSSHLRSIKVIKLLIKDRDKNSAIFNVLTITQKEGNFMYSYQKTCV